MNEDERYEHNSLGDLDQVLGALLTAVPVGPFVRIAVYRARTGPEVLLRIESLRGEGDGVREWSPHMGFCLQASGQLLGGLLRATALGADLQQQMQDEAENGN